MLIFLKTIYSALMILRIISADKHYEKVADEAINAPDSTVFAASKLQCAVLCLQFGQCGVFSYTHNGSTATCQIASDKESTVASSGSEVWKSKATISTSASTFSLGAALTWSQVREHTIPTATCGNAVSLAVDANYVYHVCTTAKTLAASAISTGAYSFHVSFWDPPYDAIHVPALNAVLCSIPASGKLDIIQGMTSSLYKFTSVDGINNPRGLAMINGLLAIGGLYENKVIFLDPVSKTKQHTLSIASPEFICLCADSSTFIVTTSSGVGQKFDFQYNSLGAIPNMDRSCYCDTNAKIVTAESTGTQPILYEPASPTPPYYTLTGHGYTTTYGLIKNIRVKNNVLYVIVNNGNVYAFHQ